MHAGLVCLDWLLVSPLMRKNAHEWATREAMVLPKARAVVLPGEGVGYRLSGVDEVIRVRR